MKPSTRRWWKAYAEVQRAVHLLFGLTTAGTERKRLTQNRLGIGSYKQDPAAYMRRYRRKQTAA